MKTAACLALFLLFGPSAQAADSCRDFVKLKQLPTAFKIVSRAAMGPAEMTIASDGKCLCNNLPSVQRSLGQTAASDDNFVCQADDSNEKGK